MRWGVVILLLTMSGCIGELWSVRTIQDIQKSEYRTELTSSQSPVQVQRCMMQTLHGYADEKGKRPYIDVAARDIGATQELTVRSPRTYAPGLYDAGGELLLLIESTPRPAGGTISTFWVHQYMLSPTPADNLKTVVEVVKGCL